MAVGVGVASDDALRGHIQIGADLEPPRFVIPPGHVQIGRLGFLRCARDDEGIGRAGFSCRVQVDGRRVVGNARLPVSGGKPPVVPDGVVEAVVGGRCG